MASTIAWLDASSDEQRRMRDIIKLFADRDSRDDLGLGQVRDSLGDALFPGSSTLHNRARYLLFVSHIYAQAASALADDRLRTWEAAFAAAERASTEMGDFAPRWVYPGSSRIHRVLTNFPLSVDEERYARLKRDLVLYRLTLGQPRQEDMLEVLTARGEDGGDLPTIDLRSPERSARQDGAQFQ